MPGPLHGLRVLGITKVWSGPQVTRILSDYGATVVDIEQPGSRDGQVPPHFPGTTHSWFRETVHAGKRSVSLDLSDPTDAATARDLACDADILVENFLPGTLEDWGLGYRRCAALNPRLIYVSVRGWSGEERARRRAYDPVIQAASGWSAINGDPDSEPTRAQTFVADEAAAVHASIGVLAALYHRHRTGQGQHVAVSMMDSLLFSSSGLPNLAASGAEIARWGNETDFVVPSNSFRCRDGHVYLSVSLNRQWRALADVIGRPELATDPGFRSAAARLQNRARINGLLTAWFAEQTCAHAERLLIEAGLVASTVQTFAEAVARERRHGNDLIDDVELSGTTTVPIVRAPARFSHTPSLPTHRAPRPGEHSALLHDSRALWENSEPNPSPSVESTSGKVAPDAS